MHTTYRLVGVLGGMGPDATVDFMARVIAATPAQCDQDHVPMLVAHNPAVPDRQAALVGGGEDPGPILASMASRLQSAGAELLVMPCNTAYAFQDDIAAAASIPLISIIDATVAALTSRATIPKVVGLLATVGCLHAKLYQRALRAPGIEVLLPHAEELSQLMGLITNIKAGDRGKAVRTAMTALALSLVTRGAEAIVAGCTEVPLVLTPAVLPVPMISSTDLLAQATVALARKDHALAAVAGSASCLNRAGFIGDRLC